jgi:hypothetical protein
MAGEDLYSALSGLNFAPIESAYGIGASAVGQSLPMLVNPYASTGKNLGMVLGGTLLTALLGYQARKDATEQSLLANQAAVRMMDAKTPQERLAFIESTPNDFMGTQGRLLAFNSRLSGQEALAKALAEQGVMQRRALAEFERTPEAETFAKTQALRDAQRGIIAEQALQEFYATPEGQAAQKGKIDRETQLSRARMAGSIDLRGTIAENQRIRDERDNQLKMGRQMFSKQLQRENPNVPAAVISETGEATAVANLAMNLAKKVREIKSYPEFIGAKNLTSLGRGLKEEYDDISDQILRIRTGAAAPVAEADKLLGIVQGTIEVDPEMGAELLERWATRAYNWSADRIASGTQSPGEAVRKLREAAAGNFAANFDVEPIVAPAGATTTTPTSGGSRLEQLQAQLEELRRTRQQLERSQGKK